MFINITAPVIEIQTYSFVTTAVNVYNPHYIWLSLHAEGFPRYKIT
jgi:hypothetical protein